MHEDQYLPVNWTDGMKINKSHFIADANASTFQQAKGISSLLDEFNYGLLPSQTGGGTDLKIFLHTDNQHQVQLRIQRCRAITRGGYYIHIDEETSQPGQFVSVAIPGLSVPFSELKNRASAFYVVLCIDPYKRIAVGAADPAETPPRLPFTMPSCSLSLVPVAETNGHPLSAFHLPVGLLMVNQHRAQLDDEYVPPCSSVNSHNELLEIHGALEAFYARMETLSLQIIQKIFQKKQTNDLAMIAQKLCEHTILATAGHLSGLKTIGIYQPPVYLVDKVCFLARLFKNSLDMFTGSGKEEFVNYCTEWCDITQAELEGAITALASHQYNHLDMHASLAKLTQFTKIISLLFTNLARLEYIGKRKEAGIFVKEKAIVHDAEESSVKRRSFLAD